MPTETSSAVAVLKQWYLEHENTFRAAGAKVTFGVSREGSGAVDIETATHLFQLVAWDNAWCLDVQIIDLDSGQSTFPVVGPCAPAEFVEKLKGFVQTSGLAASNAAT
jgi:hypothetical protein